MKQIKQWRLGLIVTLTACMMTLPGWNLRADEDPKNQQDPDIRRGYTPGTERVVTGYRLEHYGYLGGHFSRVIREYETVPCCKAASAMDGCSLTRTCS